MEGAVGKGAEVTTERLHRLVTKAPEKGGSMGSAYLRPLKFHLQCFTTAQGE